MSIPNLSEKPHTWIASVGAVTALLIGAVSSVHWAYVMVAVMAIWLYPVYAIPRSSQQEGIDQEGSR